MKYKIGIFGSNSGEINSTLPAADELGKMLGNYDDSVELITGAFAGIPYNIAKIAAESGVDIHGFSEYKNETEQRKNVSGNDLSIYSEISYLPANFPFAHLDRPSKKYRNILSIATCDAGIIISGRWGSLNEFTNLLDMQKAVGVLTGTGGIADELENLSKKISKPGQGKIIFESDPKILVEKILKALKTA